MFRANFVVERDLWDAFGDHARGRGVSASWLLRSLMVAELGGPVVGSVSAPPVPKVEKPPTVASNEGCDHPRERLERRQYGTWCGACKVRLR